MSLGLTQFLLRLFLLLYFPYLIAVSLLGLWLIVLLVQFGMELVTCIPIALGFAAILALTLVQILWAARCLFLRIPDDDPLEIRLPRQRCPKLYEWVEEIARARKVRPPGEIRVTADGVAHVRESSLGIEVLGLGGVAIAAFTQDTLAGIVAHELAHLIGGDTRLSRQALRRNVLMGTLDDQLARRSLVNFNPVVWLLRLYHAMFRLLWALRSRQQEYAADQYARVQSGAEVVAVALLHTHVTDRLPWVRLSSIAESYARSNQPVDDLFAEQARRARHVDPGEWDDACRKELTQPTGLFDSHPSLKDRLRAIGVPAKKAIKVAMQQEGPPASELIPKWKQIEKELTQRVVLLVQERQQVMMELGQIFRGRPSR